MRVRPKLLLIICLMLGSEAARAERTAQLEVVRALEATRCPDASALQAAIAARLGYDPFQAPAALFVNVTFSPSTQGLQAQVRVTDDGGHGLGGRTLLSSAEDCQELASSVELALCIAIDPVRMSRPAPPPRAPVTQPTAQRTHFLLGIGPVVGLGFEPNPSLGIVLSTALRSSSWSIGLEGRADAALPIRVARGTFSSSLLLASVVPCARREVFYGCVVASAGAMTSAAAGLSDSRTARTPSLFLGARGGLEFATRWPLAVRVDGTLQARLASVDLIVNDQPVWTSPALAGALGASVAGIFE